MRRGPTSRWLTLYSSLLCFPFFFQEREASVKSGRDQKESVTEEWVVPGRQSSLSLYFCIPILLKFISQTLLCSVFIVRKTLLGSVVKYWAVTQSLQISLHTNCLRIYQQRIPYASRFDNCLRRRLVVQPLKNWILLPYWCHRSLNKTALIPIC